MDFWGVPLRGGVLAMISLSLFCWGHLWLQGGVVVHCRWFRVGFILCLSLALVSPTPVLCVYLILSFVGWDGSRLCVFSSHVHKWEPVGYDDMVYSLCRPLVCEGGCWATAIAAYS